MFKFLLYILMKKKEIQKIPEDMQSILDSNDYISYEEWKENADIQND